MANTFSYFLNTILGSQLRLIISYTNAIIQTFLGWFFDSKKGYSG